MFLPRRFSSLLIASLLLSLTACEDASTPGDDVPQGAYDPDFGFYIANQGNFGSNGGTISYFVRDRQVIANDIYGVANNGAATGDVVQSMARHRDRAYIVVNNSNVVRIVDANSWVDRGSLPIAYPRYMAVVSDTAAYISNWNGGFDSLMGRVAIYNPSTNNLRAQQVSLTILPEFVLPMGTETWIIPASFGGERIARISNLGHTLIGYIGLGTSLSSAVRDGNGKAWVAAGNQLVRLSATGGVELRLSFSGDVGTLSTTVDGSTLFFQVADAGVYRAPSNISNVSQAVRVTTRNFADVAVDPVSQLLITTVYPNYTDPGRMLRLNATTGTVLDSFRVGVQPGEIAF